MRDPYETLGVTRTATADEIKSAYRKLAKKHHPDLGGDPEKFKELNEAHDILSDPNKKAHFDNGGFNQGFDPRANAYRSGTHFHFEDIFNNEDFMNIFAQAAGFPGARRRPKNSNIRIKLKVRLEDILEEQIKNIEINSSSNGPRKIEIKIPAGIQDGAVITYRGLGQNTYPDQPPGDLMVEIYIEPHSNFDRNNEDLISNLTIDCFQAVVGCQIDFNTIRNKKLKISIPPGTQNGTMMRIAGEGLPSVSRSKFIGNQFIKINIMVPTNLTTEQLNLVKQILDIKTELNI